GIYMKKLALLLGSLLLVGATASAKEAVVAPVEVSKEVVVVADVVEEVVVEEAFRPSGYIGLEYRAYGETEGHGDEIVRNAQGNLSDTNQDTWNRGANNRARLQTTFGVQMTENSRLEGRVRDYTNLDSKDDSVTGVGKAYGTETRLRYSYKHNDVLTSRLQYRDEENDSQNFEYMLRYTAYQNKGGLLSKVVLAPSLYHSMAADNGGNYLNTIGLDIEYAGNLPFGFTWDGTLYLDQNFYNQEFKTSATSTKKRSFDVTWEIYLYRTFGLYAGEKTNVDFNFVGGYDPYIFRQYERYTPAKAATSTTLAVPALITEKNTYSLYTALDVSVNYQLTPAVSLNGGVGAEYRNWDNENQSTANNWRWQPYAFAGMKVNF
ncbi:MAG: FomA family porin-like outer membrane protein, partial [Clostridium sp.]|uniref:FomA family porin-like outer membrane protein n=2 Tax=cellular organisms TaxID=131567 RepID=UPI003EE7F3E5